MSLKDQVRRLLRESWSSADELAEELYTILSQDDLFATSGPQTIQQTNPNTPPITIQMLPGDVTGTPINVVKPNPTPWDGGPAWVPISFTPADGGGGSGTGAGGGGTGGTGGGGTSTGSSLPDPTQSGNQQTTPAQDNPLQLPFTTLGKVLSGSGNTYTVGLWLSDPGGDTDSPFWMTVSARVKQIDPGEQVPEGTIVAATCFFTANLHGGVVCYFQPAVFLDDSA